MFLTVYCHLTDICNSNSDCQNDGTCDYDFSDNEYVYFCQCANGYSGDNCEIGMTCLFVVSCLKRHYYKLCVLLNISSSIRRSSCSSSCSSSGGSSSCSSSGGRSSCSSSLPLQILDMSFINLVPFLLWCYLNIYTFDR